MNRNSHRIAELNDQLRVSVPQGPATRGFCMVTRGVLDLPDEVVTQIYTLVRDFTGFTKDNDPYGEHDFGVVEVEGQKVFWKIDYYDQQMNLHSEDPADLDKTVRAITIMLAEEY